MDLSRTSLQPRGRRGSGENGAGSRIAFDEITCLYGGWFLENSSEVERYASGAGISHALAHMLGKELRRRKYNELRHYILLVANQMVAIDCFHILWILGTFALRSAAFQLMYHYLRSWWWLNITSMLYMHFDHPQ